MAGYGRTSRALHWAMAAGILANLGLGTAMVRAEPGLGILRLYALHKSVGISLLVLVLLRIGWHRIAPPPDLLPGPDWQRRAARASHLALYLLMLAVPLTGYLASAASGLDVVAWGVTLPSLAPASPGLDDGAFAAHRWLTRALLALVLLHAGAAVWHGFRRDGTLGRMLGG